MNNIDKGQSPFFPGQPVPVDLFIGRKKEIERITRSLNQIGYGRQKALFLIGEYGIGKSSLAVFVKKNAEINNRLLGIYVLLGRIKDLNGLATKTVEVVIREGIYQPTLSEKIRDFLSKYIGKQDLFGITINFEALKRDGPDISKGFLPFLKELYFRVKDSGIKGIMLIFDEINGISANPDFAYFIKSLVDENAVSSEPLPLMLMLCGVEERREEMIRNHRPVERIFDIVEIREMNESEMEEFFIKAFGSVNITVMEEALELLIRYSAGFPKIMHIIGDETFWIDSDNIIDKNDALSGIVRAAEEIGRKFVDHHVYKALRSKDYQSILKKLGKEPFVLTFSKNEIEKKLTPSEKKKFNNFLQRMKKLNVLRSGDSRGEYVFTSSLVRLYILLNSL